MAKESAIQKIEKALMSNNNGLTIQQLMDITNLARGTVKTYLDELKKIGRVHEEEYGQNTKVFFLNGVGDFQQKVQMYKEGILFVDVMTDPWKHPFIRIKFRNHEKDVGSIFLKNESSVDDLIDVLKKAKPQLKKYEHMLQQLNKIGAE